MLSLVQNGCLSFDFIFLSHSCRHRIFGRCLLPSLLQSFKSHTFQMYILYSFHYFFIFNIIRFLGSKSKENNKNSREKQKTLGKQFVHTDNLDEVKRERKKHTRSKWIEWNEFLRRQWEGSKPIKKEHIRSCECVKRASDTLFLLFCFLENHTLPNGLTQQQQQQQQSNEQLNSNRKEPEKEMYTYRQEIWSAYSEEHMTFEMKTHTKEKQKQNEPNKTKHKNKMKWNEMIT